MHDERGNTSSRKWLAGAALLVTALALYLLSQALPVSAHAQDWPGPGVGAAFALELGGGAAFAAMLLAVAAWRPSLPSLLSRLALGASVLVYAAVACEFRWIGPAPFCGTTDALAGVTPAHGGGSGDLLGTPCGLALIAEYFLPLSVAAGLLIWRARTGAVSRRAKAD